MLASLSDELITLIVLLAAVIVPVWVWVAIRDRNAKKTPPP